MIPRLFQLHRLDDFSGISGTGHVLDGVIFSDGKVAVRWKSDNSSVAIFDSLTQFKNIHVAKHGRSKIVWLYSDKMIDYNKIIHESYMESSSEYKPGLLKALKILRGQDGIGEESISETSGARESTQSAQEDNEYSTEEEIKEALTITSNSKHELPKRLKRFSSRSKKAK